MALGLAACLTAGVLAHGGGTVQLDTEVPPFRVVIQTNEEPSAGVFGGTVHVTTVVTSSGGDASTRLRHLRVEAAGFGPDGAQAGPIRSDLALNGAYEADLTVSEAGVWTIEVAIDDGNGVKTIAFPLEVLHRPWWMDLGVVGGLMLVPVLAIVGMARLARNRAAKRGEAAT